MLRRHRRQVAPKILEFKVKHFRGDQSTVSLGTIGESPEPILFGDDVRVQAQLSAPAYCYVIALNPDGEVQLCLPEDPSDPPARSELIHYPPGPKEYFMLNDGSGEQAFVLVAARRPLTSFEKWEGRDGLERRWKPAAARGVWSYDGDWIERVDIGDRGDVHERGGHPRGFDQVCEYLKKLPGCRGDPGLCLPGQAEEVNERRIAATRPGIPRETRVRLQRKRWKTMDNPVFRNPRSTPGVRALLAGPVLAIFISTALAQAPKQKAASPEPKPPGLIVLQGDDAKRAAELGKAIEAALKADRWDEAIARAEELLALRSRIQGPKHFETVNDEWSLKAMRRVAPMPPEDRVAYQSAFTMNVQAVALYTQGKYALAQPMLEKALEIRRRLLTDDHPRTATSYNNLAGNLQAQGKYAQAQPLLEKALEISRRLLTDDHPDTASSYDNLAGNLQAQGKYAQAQPLFEKALEISRRLLTDDHPDTATSYNNLAGNLQAQGKYAQAQPLLEKALEIHRRLLTDDHPATATSYNNLAGNLHAQGKYAQAQPLFEKALEIHRRLLTDDHPRTATKYNNLAGNLQAQGKYAQARPLFEKALEIRRRLLTDDHPDTAQSYNNLALNLQAQGKYAQAQPLYEKALEIRRRLLTDDHPHTATSYNNLAYNLDAQGKYAQAQPLYEKALEIRRRLLTDEHPDTPQSYNSLAHNLHAQGNYPKARDRWLSAVKGLESARLQIAFAGLERVGVLGSPRASLAAVLARLGQPAEAWQALEEDLGRGLLDELAARQDHRLAPVERDRLRELTAALDRLDRLVEATPKGLDQVERAKRFAELRRQRELASIALGELQAKFLRDHGPLAGPVAGLGEIQAALPAEAALVAWVDIPPAGPKAADPDGEHWGVVVRSQGVPAWVSIDGTGPDRLWSQDDVRLASQVRTELRRRPDGGPADVRPLIDRLRTQRLEPLAAALRATADGLPTARRLIILPSPHHGGHPGRGLARQGRHPDGELHPLGHCLQVPAGAAPGRPPRRPAGPGRPRLPAFREIERPRAARPRPAHQRGHARLQRRHARPEAGGRAPLLQRHRFAQARGFEDRPRSGPARADRSLARWQGRTAGIGPWQAWRRGRPQAGTPGDPRRTRSCGKCSPRPGPAPRCSPPCRARARRSRRLPNSSETTLGQPVSSSTPTRASSSSMAWPSRANWGGSASSTWRPTRSSTKTSPHTRR